MPRKAPSITVRELKPTEMLGIYPLIKQLNPNINQKTFRSNLKTMLAHKYRCIAAFSGTKMVGVLGIWEGERFWCGRYMEADNVVVDQKLRSGGVGKKMMDWLEKEAKRTKCNIIMADSYTRNHDSHRFYLREKYVILGFSLVKKLRKI